MGSAQISRRKNNRGSPRPLPRHMVSFAGMSCVLILQLMAR